MKECVKCGTQNKDNSRFCTKCGAEMQNAGTAGNDAQGATQPQKYNFNFVVGEGLANRLKKGIKISNSNIITGKFTLKGDFLHWAPQSSWKSKDSVVIEIEEIKSVSVNPPWFLIVQTKDNAEYNFFIPRGAGKSNEDWKNMIDGLLKKSEEPQKPVELQKSEQTHSKPRQINLFKPEDSREKQNGNEFENVRNEQSGNIFIQAAFEQNTELSAKELYEEGLESYNEKNYIKALPLFEKAAEYGDAEAQFQCGVMYSEGEGISVDKQKAFEYYKKSAEQGFAPAQCNYGYMLSNGDGVPEDKQKALLWYEKAAEQGNMFAQNNCGNAYYHGNGISADKQKAFIYYKSSAERGYAPAQFRVGYMYENGEGTSIDKQTAVIWYEKAAENGDGEAEKALVKIKEEIRMDELPPEELYDGAMAAYKANDYKKALNLFEKAAVKGHADAQFYAGLMYGKGEGTESDKEKAMLWYERAATQGNAKAQRNLAYLYRDGKGVKPDCEKAFQLFKEAADRGDSSAQLECGRCYFYGYGTRGDFNEAAKRFNDALQNKSSFGFILEDSRDELEKLKYFAGKIGADYLSRTDNVLYDEGADAFKAENYEKALNLFERAADSGNIKAAFMCGFMYYHALGAQKDNKKAAARLEKAADEGNIDAQFYLGQMYYELMSFEWYWRQIGEWVDKDTFVNKFGEEADVDNVVLPLYKQAAEQGHAYAALMIAKMYENGDVENSEDDDANALIWYEKAAERGNIGAQMKCYEMYCEGDGTEENLAKAVFWAERAAKSGSAEAQKICGQHYLMGEGVNKDAVRGREWLEKAALQGDAEAQYWYGSTFIIGEDFPLDLEKGVLWLVKAAENGDGKAQFMIGMGYYEGDDEFFEQDKEKGLMWLKKSADQFNADAIKYLNNLSDSQKSAQPKEEGTAIKKRGSAGNTAQGISVKTRSKTNSGGFEQQSAAKAAPLQKSKKRLSLDSKFGEADIIVEMYGLASGAPALFFQSIAFLVQDGYINSNKDIVGHMQKHPSKAVQYIGKFNYYQGSDEQLWINLSMVPPQYDKIIIGVLADSAAKKSFALGRSGICLRVLNAKNGEVIYNISVKDDFKDKYSAIVCEIVKENSEWKIKKLNYGSDKADTASALSIEVEALLNGRSPNQNSALQENEAKENLTEEELDKLFRDGTRAYREEAYLRAAALFERAARNGHKYAQYYLGKIYDEGKGVRKDQAKAFMWYEKAALQGEPASQYECGMMYNNGWGVAVNEQKALEMFKKSAEQGDLYAAYSLGCAYEFGTGTGVDLKKAQYWFEQALAKAIKSNNKYVKADAERALKNLY